MALRKIGLTLFRTLPENRRGCPAIWQPLTTLPASLDRPALQRLLEEVRANKIDVIVVYKVDRLTRSLADFAELIELFDKHNVSFVSVPE